jgi:hypothetical protein
MKKLDFPQDKLNLFCYEIKGEIVAMQTEKLDLENEQIKNSSDCIEPGCSNDACEPDENGVLERCSFHSQINHD